MLKILTEEDVEQWLNYAFLNKHEVTCLLLGYLPETESRWKEAVSNGYRDLGSEYSKIKRLIESEIDKGLIDTLENDPDKICLKKLSRLPWVKETMICKLFPSFLIADTFQANLNDGKAAIIKLPFPNKFMDILAGIAWKYADVDGTNTSKVESVGRELDSQCGWSSSNEGCSPTSKSIIAKLLPAKRTVAAKKRKNEKAQTSYTSRSPSKVKNKKIK